MMTNPGKYDDLLDDSEMEPVMEFVAALDTMHSRTIGYSLPRATDLAIENAISRGKPARRDSGVRSAWTGGRLRWTALAAGALVAAAVLAFTLVPRSAATVSADAVLKRAAAFTVPHGQYMTFLYRERDTYGPGRRGLATDCGRARPLSTVTTYSRLWLRGATPGIPQTIVQSAYIECVPCPSVMVGRTTYTYLFSCVERGTAYGVFMESSRWPSSGLASNLLYGVSTAKRLEQSLRNHRVSLHKGTLGGRAVFVLKAKGWPSEPRARITFYFDAKTYILRGVDLWSGYHSFPENNVQRIRLLRERYSAPPGSWVKATKLLPRYAPSATTNRYDFGADLIGIDFEPSIKQLRAVCPDVKSLAPLLHAGTGPLQSCRRAYPHMTASFLAWRLMESSIRRLKTAERAGIFRQPQVRASILHEHKFLTLWVTYKKSLKYS